jgi:dihydrolipoamide dehydrogenase
VVLLTGEKMYNTDKIKEGKAMTEKYDIAVIGGGPGGYVAALRGAQLKKSVLLIEREKVGGTCMNWGCIPTKHLLHQTKIFMDARDNTNIDGPLDSLSCNWSGLQKQKEEVVQKLVKGIEFLLKKNGIDILKGEASLKNETEIQIYSEEGESQVAAERIILATGSRPKELPFLPFNGTEVIDSKIALSLETVPKKMLIIGAGAIGLELGTIFLRLGTEVVVLEIMPTILPGIDAQMARRLYRILKKQGMDVHTEMKIEKSDVQKGHVVLGGVSLKNNSPFSFEGEIVLCATGRTPNTECLAGVKDSLVFDAAGFVKVNDYLETGIPGVLAIGDLIGGKLLAHKASHEGILAVENALGSQNVLDAKTIPAAVFTDPEFSCVGLTEEEARGQGIEPQVGLFSLQASGRAMTMGKLDGAVKIVADPEDRIIGAQILAPSASELLPELTLAVTKGLSLKDIASSIHIHPTLSEAIMESAMNAYGEAIHILNT